MTQRLRDARSYLRQPIVLTRGAILAGVVALGMLASAGVVLGVTGVRSIAEEKSARGDDKREALRRDLEAEVAAARRDATLARRTARLERPSDAELVQRILRALRVARGRPAIRRELERILKARTPPTRSTPATPPAPAPPQRRRRLPEATTRPPASRPPARPAPPSSGTANPPAAAPPPSSPSRPPVDVPAPPITTPLGPVTVPSVCVPRVGGVNCT